MQRAILKDIATSGLAAWDSVPFLQKVMDVVPSIIHVSNHTTKCSDYRNRSLVSALGYTPEEGTEMGPNFMQQLCHPADLPELRAYFKALEALADGEVARIEYRMKHKDGNWCWLLSYDTVFDRDINGKVIRHIGVTSDISVQKEAEQLAIAEQLKAQATNEELRAFSYSMSHDMKSPSNTLNLLLSEIQETHGETLDPDAANLLGMALETVDHMRRLVDDILNYTRMVNQEMSTDTVNLNQVLKEIVQDLTALVQSKKAIIDVPDLPLVKADRFQIKVLLQNLIENALKFHEPDKPPHIRVVATAQPADQMHEIAVHDSGIGISANKFQQIFTMFKRLNAQTDYSGSGLGLAICRRIAANHDSEIKLTSSPGAGSVFSIDLPAA